VTLIACSKLWIPHGNLAAEKREMIINKMEYETQSIQVVIQGRGDDAPVFLVNYDGIIKNR